MIPGGLGPDSELFRIFEQDSGHTLDPNYRAYYWTIDPDREPKTWTRKRWDTKRREWVPA